MAKIKIQGNASGTGTLTLTAPNTNADRTITLPDEDITLGGGVDGIVSTANATAITIDSNENVGIGDANPSFKLEANITGSRARFKANTGDATVELSSIAGRDFIIQSLSSGSFRVYDEDASAERLKIDSAGRVTMPYQPAFLSHMSGFSKPSGWNNVSPTNEKYDVNNNYSSGTFTAPVTGKYAFFWGGYAATASNGSRYGMSVDINGVQQFISGGQFSNVDTPLDGGHIVRHMSANDTARLDMYTPIACTLGVGSHEFYFGGYLIG